MTPHSDGCAGDCGTGYDNPPCPAADRRAPFWSDDHLTLYGGDCRDVLRELPDESVHCVVTSPPYWGLRDYGTASWEGGDEACDHAPRPNSEGCLGCGAAMNDNTPGCGHCADRHLKRSLNGTQPREYTTPDPARSELPNPPAGWAERDATVKPGKRCRRCGARRIDSQLGLEATPEEFVANMVGVFREVKRVLRKDGTLWLNLGDSYAGSGKGAWSDDATREANRHRVKETYVPTRAESPTAGIVPAGLKPKDLVGIPWRVAFALQADGWYLRSDIIWSKPNPMPESVTDRPTKAHEYLFLLTRSPRYYYDAEAVREPQTTEAQGMDRKPPPNKGHSDGEFGERAAGLAKNGWIPNGYNNPAGRNLRSVWNIATEPYPGAHFATFPRKLVEPCVKAGTSERGVCPECGAPWVRVVASSPFEEGRERERNVGGRTDGLSRPPGGATEWAKRVAAETTGWRPTCGHGPIDGRDGDEPYALPVPAVVLDPFAGSGTTLFVAQALGRRGVGIDLSPDYLKQALERNRQTPLGLVG